MNAGVICRYLYHLLHGQPDLSHLARQHDIPISTMSDIASAGRTIKMNSDTLGNFAEAVGMPLWKLMRYADAYDTDTLIPLHVCVKLPEKELVALLVALRTSKELSMRQLYQTLYAALPPERLDRIDALFRQHTTTE